MISEEKRQEIATILLNYRVKNNLSQQELGKKLRVSSHTIFDIEHQNKRVRATTIIKILNQIKESD